jgi:hypothetical protein
VAGRALLIGAVSGGLAGVDNDVALMADALRGRGFGVLRCVGDEASRAGILGACARFVDTVQPGDAAVVYYSGHGGLARPPASGRERGEPDLQFIVPTDYGASAGSGSGSASGSGSDGFRGITSVELSALLARLTARTPNATAIFDCCHAGRMARSAQGRNLRVKALTRSASYERVRAHIDRLRLDGVIPLDALQATGNPSLVRIVACAPEQSAYEYEGEAGLRIGMLTEAFGKALGEAGSERVTWAQLMDRIRRRVLLLAPGQRPEAQGPSRRLLFDVAEDDPQTTLRVSPLGGGRVRLECAALLGVRRGDTFALVTPGTSSAPDDDDSGRVGEVRIDRVGAIAAEGPVVLARGCSYVPIGTRAHRLSTAAPAFPVLLPEDDSGPGARELRSMVSVSPTLRVAEPDEVWPAAVRVGSAGELTIEDRFGPLHAPRPGGGEAVSRVLHDLRALAHAGRLRGLTADTEWALNAPVAFEVAQASEAGSTISVRVRNDAEYPVFVSLVEIGGSGRVRVLTEFAPSGVRLGPAERCDWTFDELGDADPAYARPVTVLLLVTAQAQDVSALAQGGVGRNRDLRPGSGRLERYDAHTVDCDIAPSPGRAGFLIDERPRHPVLRNAARVRVPGAVAVTVEELIVHDLPAALGGEVRIDAFVLTEGACAALTVRPPLESALVYRGPARERVELAIWVSGDAAGGHELRELLPLDEEPSVDAAYRALRAAVGDGVGTIGLYRGVLLARERFGVGRHPESGTRRVLDFAFAYRVEELGEPDGGTSAV